MTQHQDKLSEQGFALYLAIGFIVLISLVAGSVGTRLNIAALSEAGQSNRRMALDDAEASLGEAWLTLSAQFALDETACFGQFGQRCRSYCRPQQMPGAT